MFAGIGGGLHVFENRDEVGSRRSSCLWELGGGWLHVLYSKLQPRRVLGQWAIECHLVKLSYLNSQPRISSSPNTKTFLPARRIAMLSFGNW
jgi:hypothetical protein